MKTEFCPNCKSDQIATARDMKGTKTCLKCHYSWVPTESKKLVKASDIDQVVCNWSMDNRIALTEEQLNALVDVLCDLLNIPTKPSLLTAQ